MTEFMTEGFPYADLIILAGIALFIALRLRARLGHKIGFDGNAPASQEKPLAERLLARQPPPEELEKLKQKHEAAEAAALEAVQGDTTKSGLEELKRQFPDFHLAAFLDGAKGAFDMAFDAFAKGDQTTLKMLLSDALYQQFTQELELRKAAAEKAETTLVKIESAEVTSVRLQGTVAGISVRFASDQIHVLRDATGAITSGNASEVVRVEDEWTFERDLRSRDPNWKIVAT